MTQQGGRIVGPGTRRRGDGQSGAYEPMESNDPAFILATSGTTAKPKPVPFSRVVKNGSNRRAATSGATPASPASTPLTSNCAG